MRTTAIAVAGLALLLTAVPMAQEQSIPHLNIDIEGSVVSLTGGERAIVVAASEGVVIGRTTTKFISGTESSCQLSATSALEPGAANAWKVDVTPVQIYASWVSIRLRWTRLRLNGREATSPSGDVQVKLEPGNSIPIDSIPITATPGSYLDKCDLKAMTLRIGVVFLPRPEDDTRIVTTELWLVEKTASGVERSQTLSFRGTFNQPTDSVSNRSNRRVIFASLSMSSVRSQSRPC